MPCWGSNDRSKRIAKISGLADAATAPLCLDCHADNVPPGLAVRNSQLSDRVGCRPATAPRKPGSGRI